MSNEYKDWLSDRVVEVLLDYGAIDRVEEVCDSPIIGRKYVYGYKNDEHVAFAIWFDNYLNEWQFERRESNT